jgi:ArsR family transcriptional regulator, arsenate/arsenite/antimonite-responsive transcriptional repressor
MKRIPILAIERLEATGNHVEAFKALAHLSRLEVFFFLVKAGREVAVGEIQVALDVPGPTLSRHLDLLRRAGLIRSRKETRHIYSTVNQDFVTDLVRLLTACC